MKSDGVETTALFVVSAGIANKFVPRTPDRLCAARTCYDHIAGTLGVLLHDRFRQLEWLVTAAPGGNGYDLTPGGKQAFNALGIDIEALRMQRRRFASACLDWSERRPHIGGAMGAAILAIARKRKWVEQELDSRVLRLTGYGKRELSRRFGLEIRTCIV